MIIVEGHIRGKQRPRFNGKTRRTYTPQDTINYENWVKLCYQQQCGRHLEGSVRATIIAYYKIPKSYTKKRIQAIREGLEYPCKKPDIDNVVKIVLDSLNKIAYEDDSQVVELTVLKRYTEEVERIEFKISQMEE